MARQHVFSVETRLWHPSDGWKLFPVGETDPGSAWSEKEGGEPVGKASTEQALKDLIAAQDQIEAKDRLLVSKDHDLAQLAKAKAEAEAKVADLEQRAIAAEASGAEAQTVAAAVTKERDEARAESARLREKLTTTETAPPPERRKPGPRPKTA